MRKTQTGFSTEQYRPSQWRLPPARRSDYLILRKYFLSLFLLKYIEKNKASSLVSNLAKRPADAGTAIGMAAWTLSGTRVRILGSTEIKAQIAIEQAPSHNNAIRLSHKLDKNGVPLVSISCRAGEADNKVLSQYRAQLATYWHAVALEEACEIEWTRPDAVPPGYDLHHPCGTIAIGQHLAQASSTRN